MLDQLFNIVKQFGQDPVVNNPEVPDEHNQEVMADATKTIASGFQNITAGGGFQNILDLFKGGGNTTGGSGVADLVKNPIVSMMVGYFISKLVSKYKMSPSAASNVANELIPNSLNNLIQKTNDSGNPNITLDGLIGSLVGGNEVTDPQEIQPAQSGGGSMLQDLLGNLTGGGGNAGTAGGSGGGLDIQSIIGNLTQKAQNNFQGGDKGGSGGGGLMDMIKGFMN